MTTPIQPDVPEVAYLCPTCYSSDPLCRCWRTLRHALELARATPPEEEI